MPACASDCLVEATPAIAASPMVITVLRSIMKASIKSSAPGATARVISHRARRDRSTSRYAIYNVQAKRGPVRNASRRRLPKRDDEVSAFAGFSALADTEIGHHNRTAGAQDFSDPGHRFGRYGDAVERLGG